MATSPATDFRGPAGMPLDGILLAEELLDLAERAQAYTNAAGVVIALMRGKELLVRTSTGAAPDVGSVIPASDAFIAECLQRRKPVTCRDTESDRRIGLVFRALKTRSLIAIPVLGQPHPRGVMVVIAPLPNAFQPTHTAILMTLSDIISSKLAAREAPPDIQIEILDDPPPAITVVPETAAKPAVKEAPAIAPVPMVTAPPPVEAAPDHIALEAKATLRENPFCEPAKPADSPAQPATDAPPPAAAVPPALLKIAPLPLVEEKKSERDPGLLSPSEDPRNFKAQPAVSAAPPRPELVVKTTPKPVTPVAVAATIAAKPLVPVSVAATTKPSVMMPVAVTTIPAPVAISAVSPVSAATPALISWETPHADSSKRRLLAPAMAVAAVLIVVAVVWTQRTTSAETAPPVIPVPAVAAVAQPAAPPAAAPPLAYNDPALKLTIEHPQPKPPKPSESQAAPAEPKPRPVIEIAAAHPQPKPDIGPDVPAPSLALASTDSAVANLGKVRVAVPVPPKSELVPASLVSRTAPVYPPVARRLGVYGAVVMEVTIATDGSVKNVRVVDGAIQLRLAATEAVRQWRYKPAMLNGKPVESSAEVQVNFTR